MSALVAVTVLISLAAIALYAAFALRRYLGREQRQQGRNGRAALWYEDCFA